MKKSREESLQGKIAEKKATVAVLGLGFVGLPLMLRFAEAGYPVLGLDVDDDKIEGVKKGISHIQGVFFNACYANPIQASTDFALLREADAAIICVPTPLSKTRDPDLSLVLDAARTIARHLHPGQLVVLESTTYPGTTREVLLPLLEETGLRVGTDFFLAYSPERIDPGNKSFGLANTPKVVAGVTPGCLHLVHSLYSSIVQQVVSASGTDMAEMVKLLENTFRSVNIGLVNEFAIMCHRLGLSVWEVIDLAATKPYGFLPFYPGPGLGGHCIPVDPHYLSWKLRGLAYKARFIELADEVNHEMPHFVVEKITDALNGTRKSVAGSKILILGVAYKKDTNDVRESPAWEIMDLLSHKAAEISYHDPYVPEIRFKDQILNSVPFTASSLAAHDLVVVVTDHSQFSPMEVVEHSRLVIDARNLTRGMDSEKVVRL